jgi:hypothetical protein
MGARTGATLLRYRAQQPGREHASSGDWLGHVLHCIVVHEITPRE